MPHESKFSRTFDEFAASELPQQLHQAVIEATQHDSAYDAGEIHADHCATSAARGEEALEDAKGVSSGTAHLMFGVLALTVQWLRQAVPL